jgi:uncharacterized protein (TIGR03000 family)
MNPSQFRPCRVAGRLGLGAAALLLTTSLVLASGPPYGTPSGTWPPVGNYPWNQRSYGHGYNEPRQAAAPRTFEKAHIPPRKYTMEVAKLPDRAPAEKANRITMVAHLPADALIWFSGAPTTQRGELRYYESPPLQPGQTGWYTIRLSWREDGQWVTQTQQVPVQAGDIHCIHIIQADSAAAKKDLEFRIKDNLAKLGAEDRKLVNDQKFCAVQDKYRLGSMGPPVKVMVKGQPVFLCCEGCTGHAQDNPDKTLETVQKLKAKNGGPPPK